MSNPTSLFGNSKATPALEAISKTLYNYKDAQSDKTEATSLIVVTCPGDLKEIAGP